MKFTLPISIRYILSMYGIGMLCFTLFRCVFILVNHSAEHPVPSGILLQSLLMGIRFDTVVSGYVLIAPTIILLVSELLGVLKPFLLKGLGVLLNVLYVIAFAICATDIPFFKNFGNRLNVTILNWTDTPIFMAKMVLQEWSYLVYLLLFLFVAVVYVRIMRKVRKRFVATIGEGKVDSPLVFRLVLSLVVVGLMILGIRGRTEEKTGIKVGTAYFSNYDFANQAGLNPVFTFGLSYLDSKNEDNKRIHLMDEQDALQYARAQLHADTICKYGVLRKEQGIATSEKPNVVIVLMESMSSVYLQRFGNTQHLTPHLDSLACAGYSFDNFYSAGIHTFNGIYSTLYSMPAIMAKHTMFDATIPQMTGLPYVLKHSGYKTLYFTTHDDQFDNVGGFLKANHMDSIISKKDFPSNEILSTLGVPDHFMFDYSLPILDRYASNQQPFLAVMMTASNHGPYIVPKNIPFAAKHTDVRGGTVEYADWAIGHFMEQAKSKLWYRNTIFVFVADHGSYDGESYGNMPISLSHIPCIVYSPMLHDAPRVIHNPGGQIDVFPTIAGLLGIHYSNNTMGIDLLHQQRPYMYFSQDDKIGVVDTSMLYTWHPDGWENMYLLKTKQPILDANKLPATAMKRYAFSMLQCTQWMLENKQTGLEKVECK